MENLPPGRLKELTQLSTVNVESKRDCCLSRIVKEYDDQGEKEEIEVEG